ncbi:MAG: hypothetical protein DRH43_04995 [Deltaproteobacteria bacterium]|nr:MAG: hypothetical protein DRH43_04995 [Deltaproteobacteria bacterium]
MTSPVASLRFVKKRFRPSEKEFGQQAVYGLPTSDLPELQAGTCQARINAKCVRFNFPHLASRKKIGHLF